jgi:hypothetical protein
MGNSFKSPFVKYYLTNKYANVNIINILKKSCDKYNIFVDVIVYNPNNKSVEIYLSNTDIDDIEIIYTTLRKDLNDNFKKIKDTDYKFCVKHTAFKKFRKSSITNL